MVNGYNFLLNSFISDKLGEMAGEGYAFVQGQDLSRVVQTFKNQTK